MKASRLALRAALAASSLAAALPASAAVSLTSAGSIYLQDFASLASTGSTPVAWTNESTLAGWSLFSAANAPLTSYLVGTGSGTGGSFYSFGSAGSGDRALGGLGSGGAYFGSPASGALAGYIAVAFSNDTGSLLGTVTISFQGEQWRNGGNTSAHTMALSYGFGSSFDSVSWTSPGGSFDWASPVTGSSAATVDGNGAGRVSGLGGTLATAWAPGQTLWLRWAEVNNTGSDHGLAIDDLSLAVTAVPEPESLALMLAGLAALGLLARRSA